MLNVRMVMRRIGNGAAVQHWLGSKAINTDLQSVTNAFTFHLICHQT